MVLSVLLAERWTMNININNNKYVVKALDKLRSGVHVTTVVMTLSAIGITLCCLVSEYPAASIVSLILLISAILTCVAGAPHLILRYFAILFAALSCIAGCFVCEFFHVDLMELSRTSGYVGSLPLLCLSYGAVLAAVFLGDGRISSLRQEKEKKSFDIRIAGMSVTDAILRIICIGMLVVNALAFLTVANRPSFVIGVDRFAYDQLFGINVFEKISGLMTYISLALLLAIRSGYKKVPLAAIGLYILYLIWTGEKFGGFFVLLANTFFVYSDKFEKIDRRKAAAVMVAAILSGVFVVLGTVALRSFTSDANSVQFLISRTAQQGQLWWATYADDDSGVPHLDEFFAAEPEALMGGRSAIKDNVGESNGIYGVMYRVAPQNQVDVKLSAGSRYSEGGFPAAYYYFGPIGAIGFGLLHGVLFTLVVYGMLKAVKNRDPIRLIIFGRLFMLLRTSMSMFTFFDFLDLESIACYAYLLLAPVVSRSLRSKLSIPSR